MNTPTLTIEEINSRIKIGLKFYSIGKRKDVTTINDIFTTTNSKGEVVRVEYFCSHVFMGQTVSHLENKTTIARSIFTNGFID